jgi:hypothetical protein
MCHRTGKERAGWRTCECDAASLERAHLGVGRMDVYLPFPHADSETSMSAPPCNESLFVGYWYSTPHSSECPAGAAIGTRGCSWRRIEGQQTIVRGGELIAAGWKSLPPNASLSILGAVVEHNAALVETLLAARTPRCCGC